MSSSSPKRRSASLALHGKPTEGDRYEYDGTSTDRDVLLLLSLRAGEQGIVADLYTLQSFSRSEAEINAMKKSSLINPVHCRSLHGKEDD